MQLVATMFIGTLLVQGSLGAGGHWTYTENTGPSHWGSMFQTCAGKQQSPINIETSNVRMEYWSPFTLKNYDQPPTRMRIKNNGHSAQVEMDAPAAPRVLNGGLKEEYIFAQFHFHWGSESTMGSEHTIDGVRYPMEMHLVHYKASYGTIGEAVKRSDGLAVLGVMFEISQTDNAALAPLVNALRNITEAGNFVQLSANYPLQAYLPNDLKRFYRYDGSLTTPTCNEVVTWTVFAEPVPVSENQMHAFRNLRTEHGSELVNNFRPPQPLSDRKVMVMSPGSGQDSATMKKMGLVLYFMSSMAILLMNM